LTGGREAILAVGMAIMQSQARPKLANIPMRKYLKVMDLV